jgi:hypothetical protein
MAARFRGCSIAKNNMSDINEELAKNEGVKPRLGIRSKCPWICREFKVISRGSTAVNQGDLDASFRMVKSSPGTEGGLNPGKSYKYINHHSGG